MATIPDRLDPKSMEFASKFENILNQAGYSVSVPEGKAQDGDLDIEGLGYYRGKEVLKKWGISNPQGRFTGNSFEIEFGEVPGVIDSIKSKLEKQKEAVSQPKETAKKAAESEEVEIINKLRGPILIGLGIISIGAAYIGVKK